MKCFLKDADCREDCQLYQEGYKTCAFDIVPVLFNMVVKQLKELTDSVETLAFELMQDRVDSYYPDAPHFGEETEEASKR